MKTISWEFFQLQQHAVATAHANILQLVYHTPEPAAVLPREGKWCTHPHNRQLDFCLLWLCEEHAFLVLFLLCTPFPRSGLLAQRRLSKDSINLHISLGAQITLTSKIARSCPKKMAKIARRLWTWLRRWGYKFYQVPMWPQAGHLTALGFSFLICVCVCVCFVKNNNTSCED